MYIFRFFWPNCLVLSIDLFKMNVKVQLTLIQGNGIKGKRHLVSLNIQNLDILMHRITSMISFCYNEFLGISLLCWFGIGPKPIFITAPAASKNDAPFKYRQMWLENIEFFAFIFPSPCCTLKFKIMWTLETTTTTTTTNTTTTTFY